MARSLQTNGQYYSVHGKVADRIARFYYSTAGVIKDSLGLKYLTRAPTWPVAQTSPVFARRD